MHPEPASSAPAAPCPRCRQPSTGTYCGQCGWDRGLPYADYAGFGVRFAARLADLLFEMPLLLPAYYLLLRRISSESLLDALARPEDQQALQHLLQLYQPALVWFAAYVYVADFAYTMVFLMNWGATPGKMLLGLKVYSTRRPPGRPGLLAGAEPPRITPLQALTRNLVYLATHVLFGVGFLWIFLDPRRRAWHDAAADTVVARRGSPPSY